jgi:hypothetical protein
MDWRSAEFMDQWSPAGQGFLIVACATALLVVGITMLWLGRYLVRGLRFLFCLAFDRLRYLAGVVRKKYRATRGDRLPLGDALFAK